MNKIIFLSGIIACCTFCGRDYRPPKISDSAIKTYREPQGLQFQLAQADNSPDSPSWFYRIKDDNHLYLDWAPIGISFESDTFPGRLSLISSQEKTVVEEYELPVGKNRKIKSTYLEFLLEFSAKPELPQSSSALKKGYIRLRMNHSGSFFRFELPKDARAKPSGKMLDEFTSFHVRKNSVGWLQEYQEASNISPAYEYYFEKHKAGDSDCGKATIRAKFQPLVAFTGLVIFGCDGWAMPALFEIPEKNKFVLIHESGLDENYAAVHLNNTEYNNLYKVHFPAAKEGNADGASEPEIKLPWVGPWRIIHTGNLADIMNANSVTDLGKHPNRQTLPLQDWIQPGKSAWDWWFYLKTGDLARQKKYVDAAHDFSWNYVLVDANWNKWNNGNPEPSIKELVQYAAAKRIGIHLWYNSAGPQNSVTEEPRDLMHERKVRRKEFEKISSWGIRGVKIDFWSSDKQKHIRQYLETLEDAYDFKLMVNFHGSTMPRGWERNFPHLMTMESVKGAEWYRFPIFRGPKAQDNVHYYYTRNFTGAMDYTPMVFAEPLSQQKIPYSHSLALGIIFFSGIQHFADSVLEKDQGFQLLFAKNSLVKEFLRDLPTVWDESRFLYGHPDSLAAVLRKQDNAYYLGVVSSLNNKSEFAFRSDYLPEGDYEISVIHQGEKPDTLKNTKYKFRGTKPQQPSHVAQKAAPNAENQEIIFQLDERSGLLARITRIP